MQAWIAIVSVLLVAGCAAPAVLRVAPLATVPQQDVSPLPPADRPLAGSVRIHEEAIRGSSPLVLGQPVPEPRDVNLTFHGLQPVYDEFARERLAFVLRYPDHWYQESGSLLEGVQPSGTWVTHLDEYAFDAADGRFLGGADTVAHARGFAWPDQHSAMTGNPMMLAMLLKAAGGPTGIIPSDHWREGGSTNYQFAPWEGPRLLPGNCTPWELTASGARTLTIPFLSGNNHAVVCLQPGQEVPLWTYVGSNETGALTFTRLSPSWTLPRFEGQSAPAVEGYDAKPWVSVGGLAGVAHSVLMPPSSQPGDWADRMSSLATVAYLSPMFLLYAHDVQDAYLSSGFVDIPYAYAICVLSVCGPSGFDHWNDLGFTNAQRSVDQQIYGKDGVSPEQPDTFTPGLGFQSVDQTNQHPTAADLPKLVPAGQVYAQLAPFMPVGRAPVVFAVFSASNLAWFTDPFCGTRAGGHSSMIDAPAGVLLGYSEWDAKACATGPSSQNPAFGFGANLDPRGLQLR